MNTARYSGVTVAPPVTLSPSWAGMLHAQRPCCQASQGKLKPPLLSVTPCTIPEAQVVSGKASSSRKYHISSCTSKGTLRTVSM